MAEEKSEAKKAASGWISTAVDYGPLLIFLGVYFYNAPDADSPNAISQTLIAVLTSTGAFMIAAIVALGLSKWLTGHVSKMLMLSTVLIIGFGGLTILLRDPFWVQIKPTALYLFFGTVLLIGWWRGKALLQWLLEAAFEGVDDEGWLKLSRNWGLFFFALAGLNEALRLSLTFGGWLTAKTWAFLLCTFLFSASQIPMLLKHGLDLGEEDEAEANDTPTEK
ncbi:MAG: inner membrane-spanning protein YciB [Pseudomonadota bacterium]|nr:inner membrane-spanning protein YciB [Pseudomonadota bacterium]